MSCQPCTLLQLKPLSKLVPMFVQKDVVLRAPLETNWYAINAIKNFIITNKLFVIFVTWCLKQICSKQQLVMLSECEVAQFCILDALLINSLDLWDGIYLWAKWKIFWLNNTSSSACCATKLCAISSTKRKYVTSEWLKYSFSIGALIEW